MVIRSNSSTVATLVKTFPMRMTFSWHDYVLFTVMLILSTLTGIYFGCFGNKQSNINEYLMGGKTMKILPIAVSLVASEISSIMLLSVPAEVYRHGAAFSLGIISMVFMTIINIYVYLPVFFSLQVTSIYEYLERRFDNRTRLFASFLFTFLVALRLPIIIYVPALALSAVTNFNVHLILPIVCGICIFYTTIGGLKTVVWTDVLQFLIFVATVTTVFAVGIKLEGGFLKVWNEAADGGRLDIFDFDPDPTKRDSFWIIIIGYTVHYVGLICVSPNTIQKLLAVATFRETVLSALYHRAGVILIQITCIFTGFVMYAKYSNCDPFTTKKVKKLDQLLPYYVMDITRHIPGLSGLFIAGVFSASLSTVSATLNCLAGVIYKDFVSKFLNENVTEKNASNILKIIVVITGLISTGLVLIIEYLGDILQLAISLTGITNGVLLATFTVGFLVPKANAKGAFYGAIGGLLFISFIVFPAKYYQLQGLLRYTSKPLSTEKCEFFNETNSALSVNDLFFDKATKSTFSNTTNTIKGSTQFQPHFIFRISHYYYSLIGAVVSTALCLIISYMTNKNDPPVDKSLISPVSYWLLPKEQKIMENVRYKSVETALHSLESDS